MLVCCPSYPCCPFNTFCHYRRLRHSYYQHTWQVCGPLGHISWHQMSFHFCEKFCRLFAAVCFSKSITRAFWCAANFWSLFLQCTWPPVSPLAHRGLWLKAKNQRGPITYIALAASEECAARHSESPWPDWRQRVKLNIPEKEFIFCQPFFKEC